jgi:DNA-binding transcriptional ArsR family regulator
VARAATTSDVFNAVAEGDRRAILDLLAHGALPVGHIVERLDLTQPQVSKHLMVLRTVGLVRARSDGRQRIYRVDGRALQPLQDWLAGFTAVWDARLNRLEDYVGQLDNETLTQEPQQ